MTIPDYQSLMAPVLRKAAQGEVHVREAIEQLGDELGLTEEERMQLLPSGRKRTFDDRVHLAKSYLTQAGLVELTRRGHFRITDRGRKALEGDPERIDNAYLSRFPEFADFVKRKRRDRPDQPPGDVAAAGDGDVAAAEVAEAYETPDALSRAAHGAIEEASNGDVEEPTEAGVKGNEAPDAAQESASDGPPRRGRSQEGRSQQELDRVLADHLKWVNSPLTKWRTADSLSVEL